jgi:nicotinamidase/pyrazinamidase
LNSLADHIINPNLSALVIIDMQPDFLPGGPLAVTGGDELLKPIAALMESGAFALVATTQDWHPHGHISFASSHKDQSPMSIIELYGHDQVMWPDHCVQGTRGAELHGDLPWQTAGAIIRKGTDLNVDSYSGFRNNYDASGARPSTGMSGLLKDRGITQVYICGLARDFCCRWSAEDAADFGFDVTFLWDLTRAVNPEDNTKLEIELASKGINILTGTKLKK